jgi:hypothetical protein
MVLPGSTILGLYIVRFLNTQEKSLKRDRNIQPEALSAGVFAPNGERLTALGQSQMLKS